MRYTTLLFDLDGTLTDSGPGIRNGISHVLKKYHLPPMTLEELNRFVGPPLVPAFQEYCVLSAEEAVKAVDCYREYYATVGLFENAVYDGMADLLCTARQAGYTLTVATSKPTVFAERILEHFGLLKEFSLVVGSNLDETRTSKPEVITYLLEQMPAVPKEKVLMIGDRNYDVLGARECGIDCAGVLYGFGGREELEQAGAVYIAQTVLQLKEKLLAWVKEA